MDYRALGRTGLKVSVVSLGTMTWGEQNTAQEAFAQMDFALDAGLNLWDAAELYPIPPRAETVGRTEEIIGDWLKARGARHKIILATKVVGRTGMSWFRASGQGACLDRANIIEAVESSLRRLKTDVIDLYQVHWPDRDILFGGNPTTYSPSHSVEVPLEVTLEALHGLVEAGKIRHIGLSNESAWGTMTYLRLAAERGWPRIASLQNCYNLISRPSEIALAEVCVREGVSFLAYSPLAQGYLTGKYEGGALPDGSRKALFNRLQRYERPGADVAITAYVKLARAYGLDPAQMAIAFAVSRPFITSTVIGATTLTQLQTNIAASKLSLPDEVLTAIQDIHQLHMNPAP